MDNMTTVQTEALKEPAEKKTSRLEKKDITKAMWIYYLGAELSNSYERLQSLIFCASMTPVLKKLYDTDEELSKALKRHLVFFNTEGTFGAVIQGIAIMMEEEKATGKDVTDDAITGLKTGLMGPIAGIGDAIIWAALMPILISIFLPFASNGSPMGGLLPLILYPLITIGVSYVLIHQGYTLGKKSVTSLLNGGKMQSIIFSANVIGLTMMGALSASYVKLSTPLTFVFSSGNKIVLQDILNLIVPGLLPLLAVFLIYFYLKKRGPRYNLILGTIVVVSVAAAFLGIL
jgi:Phosphotransferase system, mannose/fructose/N-acetylgalactosamine-specific component IID